MPTNFDRAFDFLMKQEGGYSDLANDPGGRTNFGISQRAYPNEDILHLTKDRAKQIYKVDYWDKLHCDEISYYPLAVCLFDYAVNSGVATAIKTLQHALCVPQDGTMGPITFRALSTSDPKKVSNKIIDSRLELYIRLSSNPTKRIFLLGWLRRLFDVQREV